MNPARREVLRVFGLALLLLPPCLALWFFAAGAVGWLPTRLASPAIVAAAGPVTSIETAARHVIYTVRVEGPYRPGGSPQVEARVEVPSATYTFGIAIFLALALASKGWRQPARLALGIAILLPLPVVGIAFDALRQLGASPQLAQLLAWRGGTREAIALGYQVGSLLLPTLAPIAAWLALFWLPTDGKPSPASRSSA
jgi:hypothetical protein